MEIQLFSHTKSGFPLFLPMWDISIYYPTPIYMAMDYFCYLHKLEPNCTRRSDIHVTLLIWRHQLVNSFDHIMLVTPPIAMNYLKRDWTIGCSFYTKKAWFEGVKIATFFQLFLFFKKVPPEKSCVRITILVGDCFQTYFQGSTRTTLKQKQHKKSATYLINNLYCYERVVKCLRIQNLLCLI